MIFIQMVDSLNCFNFVFILHKVCCNLNFGFATKVGVCKACGPRVKPRITFHALGSVRTCERMNPHTPKRVPILGIGVPMDS